MGNISILTKSTPHSSTNGSKFPLPFLNLGPVCPPKRSGPIQNQDQPSSKFLAKNFHEDFRPIILDAEVWFVRSIPCKITLVLGSLDTWYCKGNCQGDSISFLFTYALKQYVDGSLSQEIKQPLIYQCSSCSFAFRSRLWMWPSASPFSWRKAGKAGGSESSEKSRQKWLHLGNQTWQWENHPWICPLPRLITRGFQTSSNHSNQCLPGGATNSIRTYQNIYQNHSKSQSPSADHDLTCSNWVYAFPVSKVSCAIAGILS